MKRVVKVIVSFEPIGEPQYGQWCPTCMLPSGVNIPGLFAIGKRTELAVLEVCMDCDRSTMHS